MESAEIVGGTTVREILGGTELELRSEAELDEQTENDEARECVVALQNYLKLECLDEGESYDGSEPFEKLAEQMENLVSGGKVKKKILREGYGEPPDNSTKVFINYNAYVQFEAQPFDSTYARKQRCSFELGEGNVIEGLEIAVKSMKINEKSQFLIDPELAYKSGVLHRIPPNSVVLFEIELCEIQNVVKKNPEEEDKSFAKVESLCTGIILRGKNLFRLKDYRGAIKEFTQAVIKLEDATLSDYHEQIECEKIIVRLYTNLLVCCTQANIPKRGCVYAQKIYEMSKNKTFKVSAKVYFNHAKCQRMLGGFEHAERKLRQAKALEPNSTEILEEFNLLKKAKEDQKKREQKFGQALLNG